MLCTPSKVNINILLENMNKKSIIYDRLSIETCVEDKIAKRSNEKKTEKKPRSKKTEKPKAEKKTKKILI